MALALVAACAGDPRANANANAGEPDHTATRQSPGANANANANVRAEPAELRVHELGEGLPVVVLLHGYGARGDDLVPLARQLQAQTGGRYLMPEATYPMDGGGRRWFGRRAEGFGAAEVQHSRRAVERLIGKLESEGVPRNQIVLGGFSQGAMLTTDVALAGSSDAPLGGLLILSGSIMDGWDLASERVRGVPVLVAHGRQDLVLPFAEAQRLGDALDAQGAELTWLPFDGGHTIPREAVDATHALVTRVGQQAAAARP